MPEEATWYYIDWPDEHHPEINPFPVRVEENGRITVTLEETFYPTGEFHGTQLSAAFYHDLYPTKEAAIDAAMDSAAHALTSALEECSDAKDSMQKLKILKETLA